jgi:acyl carrier protein
LKCGNRASVRPDKHNGGGAIIQVGSRLGDAAREYHDKPISQWLAGADRPSPIQGREGAAMSDIGERVKKIVVEHLGVEADKVTDNASFIDDLGADSLDTVELVMAFEEEFGCEIPDDAAETILTVGDAVKFLEKNAKS